MQIITKEQKFKTTAEKEEIKFEVDTLNPAIMIKIVSDMYPNPRQTLLTEYVQNALDSHGQAGCPETPVEIQLPSELEPNYIVRDRGIGMTEKDIKDTFKYVFRSTKNTDPDQLGGFGIGKLVFGAYSGIMYLDLFDGENVQNFLVRLKDGFAGCQEQYISASKEQKGVQVTVPVFTKDIDYFREVAVFQYGFLRTQPKIIGEEAFFDEFNEWTAKNLLVETKDGLSRLYNNRTNDLPEFIGSHTHHPQALIGGLPFKIDFGTLLQNTSTKRDKDALEILQDRFFTIEFGPNDVDIVPSRDNLKYNMKTCRAVLHRMCQLMDRVYEYIEKEMENIEELPELWRKALDFKQQGLINTAHVKQLEWDGHSGAVHDYGELLNNTDANYGMYKAFTAPSSKVTVGRSRKEYQQDPENHDTEYLWDGNSCEVLLDAERYLYDAVKVLRMNRRNIYSYRMNGDHIVLCDDIRSSLNILTLGAGSMGCPLGDHREHKDVTVIVAGGDMGKGDADKRITYELNQNEKDYNVSRTMVLHLNDNYTFKDFVERLVGLKIGIPEHVFVDAAKLDKPQAGVRVTRDGNSSVSSPSDTSFSDNTMFVFNKQGHSPSNAFNKTFWDPASKETLKDLSKDDSVELVYVRAKSYKPQPHNADVDTKLEIPSKRCMEDTWLGPKLINSAVFRGLLLRLEHISPKKQIVLIGVKPKVDMTKFPNIKHLQKFCEDTYAGHLKTIPKTVPTYLTEACIVENAVIGMFKGMHKKFSDNEKELTKMVPSYKKLNKLFGSVIKLFNQKHSTNTNRAGKICNSLDALSELSERALKPDHKKLVKSYSDVSKLDDSLKSPFEDITIQDELGLNYWSSPGDENVQIPNVLVNALYRSLTEHTKGFSNRQDFSDWMAEFGKGLDSALDIDEIFGLVQDCWQEAGSPMQSALPFFEKEFPDIGESLKKCFNQVSGDARYLSDYKAMFDVDGFTDFIPNVGSKRGDKMFGFMVLCFLATHLWIMNSNTRNRNTIMRRPLQSKGLQGAMHVASAVNTAYVIMPTSHGWDKTSALIYKWISLLMLQGVEKVASIKGLDKTTISIICDINRLS